MKTEWVLSREAFDTFLAWLDPDRDRAGEKYEEIRRKLIEHFLHLGYSYAEELTDKTINRVIRRLAEIAGEHVGDPMLYFYAETRMVFIVYRAKGPGAKLISPYEIDMAGGVNGAGMDAGRLVLKAAS